MVKDLLTVKEVADLLELKIDTVRKKASKGELPGGIKIGDSKNAMWRFDRNEILGWLEEKRVRRFSNLSKGPSHTGRIEFADISE